MWTGMRIVRAWSAMARVIACLIARGLDGAGAGDLLAAGQLAGGAPLRQSSPRQSCPGGPVPAGLHG
ncbi:hypothetical protein ABZW49_24355, partial [Nonomuraea wenchangensis]